MGAVALSFNYVEDLEEVKKFAEKKIEKRYVYLLDSDGLHEIEWKGTYNPEILELSGYKEIGEAKDGKKIITPI